MYGDIFFRGIWLIFRGIGCFGRGGCGMSVIVKGLFCFWIVGSYLKFFSMAGLLRLLCGFFRGSLRSIFREFLVLIFCLVCSVIFSSSFFLLLLVLF